MAVIKQIKIGETIYDLEVSWANIPDAPGFLPLSGGTMTGNLTIKQGSAINVDIINGATLGNAIMRQNASTGEVILGSTARPLRLWGNQTRPSYSTDNGANKGLAFDNEVVKLTGDQTITGMKTFNGWMFCNIGMDFGNSNVDDEGDGPDSQRLQGNPTGLVLSNYYNYDYGESYDIIKYVFPNNGDIPYLQDDLHGRTYTLGKYTDLLLERTGCSSGSSYSVNYSSGKYDYLLILIRFGTAAWASSLVPVSMWKTMTTSSSLLTIGDYSYYARVYNPTGKSCSTIYLHAVNNSDGSITIKIYGI